MADLIAQGPEPQQRWRRDLPAGRPIVLGRKQPVWSTPWDEHISRAHAELSWKDQRLHVRRLPDARNPIFFRGQACDQFVVAPGEHFVIGNTTFTVSESRVNVSVDLPLPEREHTFSPQFLQRVGYRNADQRIEILSRLPDVISGATSQPELSVRLLNLLMSGIPRADAVALVAVDVSHPEQPVTVIDWDRRRVIEHDFAPSQRLIQEAIRRGESVLHVWKTRGADAYTEAANIDWAFCTPVLGAACRGWGIYVAGRFSAGSMTPGLLSDPTDLRDDLKFTELAASTLSSLRQLRLLDRRQAGFSQFFSPVVMEALETDDPEVVLTPRETNVSVLFCDLRGFSLEAERSSGNLIDLLRRVSKALGVMTHQILDHGGVVGDFHGDAAMGFWGWPLPAPDAVERCCLAALAIRAQFDAAAQRADHPLTGFRAGIGVATGRAVAGKIGTEDQVKVTVFGPVVNLAARLEGMTKIFRAAILLDEPSAEVARRNLKCDVGRLRRIARVRPYGMDAVVAIHELLPPLAELPELTNEYLAQFEAALEAFEAGRWSQAFDRLCRMPQEDPVKDYLITFIAQHGRQPPADWRGVLTMERK